MLVGLIKHWTVWRVNKTVHDGMVNETLKVRRVDKLLKCWKG